MGCGWLATDRWYMVELGVIDYIVYCQTKRRCILPWKITSVGHPSCIFKKFFETIIKHAALLLYFKCRPSTARLKEGAFYHGKSLLWAILPAFSRSSLKLSSSMLHCFYFKCRPSTARLKEGAFYLGKLLLWAILPAFSRSSLKLSSSMLHCFYFKCRPSTDSAQ